MKLSPISVWERVKRVDPILFLCTLFPSVMSILTLWGARNTYTNGTRRVFVQLAAIVLGIICTFVIANFDYKEVVDKLFWVIFAASVVLLVSVLLFGTAEGRGKSYIVIPFLPVNLQPAEFTKITFVITFARHLDLVKGKINHPRSLLGLALHAGLIIGLVLLERDLGQALVYIAFTLIMLFGAGLSLWYYLGGLAAVVLAAPYLWPLLEEDQQKRIIYSFQPELDPLDVGWQAIKSKAALAAGGVWGQGMDGASAYAAISKKGSYTDFIFPIFGEMFGFVGCLALILCYIVLIVRLLVIARSTRKDLGSFICIGIAGVLIAQCIENIGMCVGLLPVIGITLPFMSYGGSSMLAMYLLVAIAHSVQAHRSKYYFEREET